MNFKIKFIGFSNRYKLFALYAFVFCFVLYAFSKPCLSRDLIVYSQYAEKIVPPEYFIVIAPYIASSVYVLQIYYLCLLGFSPVLLICYIAITAITVGVNQLVLSIGFAFLLWSLNYYKCQALRFVPVLIHPSLALILLYNKFGNSKLINLKATLVLLCLWFSFLILIGPVEFGEFLSNIPQGNISHFGYYLTNHYLSHDHEHVNSLVGFENVIFFAIISLSTNRWQPFFFELIAFQIYTLFGTIPQPMGFRMFEVFTYLTYIFGYRLSVVRVPWFLAFFAFSILAYKIKYVFGCSYA